MSYLPAIPAVPRSVLIALGTIGAVIVVWLWARISRTRHVVIQASESVQTAVIQLERIANSMDRIVFLNEARQRALEETRAREAAKEAAREAAETKSATAPAPPEPAPHVALSASGR